MSETILLHYRLTRELWRAFFEAHYRQDRALRRRYLWGVACIVIGTLGFGGGYDGKVIAALLLTTGFLAVLSRPLLVLRSLRRAGNHPFFGREVAVAVAPEALSVRSGTAGYSQPWSNFAGYHRATPGFLLYHDRHAFFFIPAGAMTAGQARRIEEILAAAEVPHW